MPLVNYINEHCAASVISRPGVNKAAVIFANFCCKSSLISALVGHYRFQHIAVRGVYCAYALKYKTKDSLEKPQDT